MHQKGCSLLFYVYTCGMGNKISDMSLPPLVAIDVSEIPDDFAEMSGRSVADFLKSVKAAGIMPIDTSKPVGMKGHSGPIGPKGELGAPGLLMSMREFGEKLQELACYGDLPKDRYFILKKLYASNDVESANMGCRIVSGLHEKMMKN